jgi:hypothetical protein
MVVFVGFHGKLLVSTDVNFGGENFALALPPDVRKGSALPKRLA